MAKLKQIMYAKGGRLPKYAGGGALPWGEIINAGTTAGKNVEGDQTDEGKNYVGHMLTPTHQNVVDSFSSGSFNEIADNVVFQGLLGTTAHRKSKEANELHRQQLLAQQDYYAGLGEQRMFGYDTTGGAMESNLYAMGGQLQKLNSNTVEVEGRTHAQGGVKLSGVGAEVEDNETISKGYVFSDQLGFADKHKVIAKQIGKIEQRPSSPEKTNSLTILRGKENVLKQAQETVRQRMFDSQNGSMNPGGSRKYADGGALDPIPLTGAGLTSGLQMGNFAVPSMPETSSPSYSGAIGSGPSYISTNDWRDSQSANNGSSWGEAITQIAPYVTNALNAARKLPMPPTPLREAGVRANLIDYAADKNELERQTRAMNKSVRQATSNPSIANAISASNLGSYLDSKAKLSQAERNTNAQIMNNNAQFNAGINARNTARYADYRNELVARMLAQQNIGLENAADASNKFQQQRRDRSMMDLENRKLDILPRLYKDTGVVDRNTEDLLKNERYEYGGSIHIDPSKRGTFTAAATDHNMGVQAFASQVLSNKDKYSTAMVRKANFARNASKWNH